MAVNDYRVDNGITPIISNRAPTTRDKSYELGQCWIDKVLNDVYFLTSVKDNSANWVGAGGGTGDFSALRVSPGNATVTDGNLVVTAGTITATAMGAGVVQSSVAGTMSSSKGDDGEILIGSTSGLPAWATLTEGSGITITNTANSIVIDSTGATASSFAVTTGGPVTPNAGVTTVVGYDANITTNGATANTIKIRLSDDVTTVGALTAGNDLNMTSGACTIVSSENTTQAIYLHANGGTSEQIEIRADQGTAVDSVYLLSDVGGLTLASGLASADAINISATDAAGGIDIDAGTAGINMTAANGAIALISGTGNITIGTDSAQHNVTLGSTNGTSGVVIQSGTGDLDVNGGGLINITGAGATSMNSSAGVLNIGNLNHAQNINIGTGAAARTITIGNDTGATALTLNAGTGAVNIATNGRDHATTIGSTTGSSAFLAQTGTGTLTLASGGILATTSAGASTIDATGALELNSSAGVIQIGQDAVSQNINIGIAGTRTLTMGSATAGSSVVINTGTGNLDLGVNATEHTVRLGSTTTASATSIRSGTGAMTFVGGGDITVDTAGVIELNSTGAAISIGQDANAYGINIGTGAAARPIVIGNSTSTTAITLNAGTSGINVGTNAVAFTTTIGNTTGASQVDLRAGSGGVHIKDTDLTIDTAAKGIVFNTTIKIITGAGAPSAITAPQGSLYLRTDGSSTSTRAYINMDGGTNWTAITTAG